MELYYSLDYKRLVLLVASRLACVPLDILSFYSTYPTFQPCLASEVGEILTIGVKNKVTSIIYYSKHRITAALTVTSRLYGKNRSTAIVVATGINVMSSILNKVITWRNFIPNLLTSLTS